MKIKSIEIEGMHKIKSEKFDFSTKDANYLFGPNGAGKSTVLEAIQLGLLGYIPGTAKRVSDIFEHANGRQMSITIVLEHQNSDIIVIREFTKTRNKIDSYCRVSPSSYDIEGIIGNLELPILNFNEFTGLSANKQKDLMISILPSSLDSIDIEKYLKANSVFDDSEEMSEFIKELLEDWKSINSIEKLKEFNAYMKEQQAALTAEEKRITATSQQLIFYDDYSGEENVDKLKSDITALMKLRDTALAAEQTEQMYQSQLKQLELYKDLKGTIEDDEEYTKFTQAQINTFSEIEKISKEIKEIETTQHENQYDLDQLIKIIQSNGICPYFEDNCEQLESAIPKFEENVARIENDKVESTKLLSEKQNKLSTLKTELQEIEHGIGILKNKYAKRDMVKAAIQQPQTYVCGESSQQLADRINKLNDDLVKASANQKYNELLGVVTKEKLKLVPKIEFVKQAVKLTGANGLQSELMNKPFDDLTNTMKDLVNLLNINELGQPEFILEEKANSFNFGFMRGTTFIPFKLLSSGEKCVFVLIFMIAITKNADSMIEFVLIDDLLDHLDDARFKTVIDNVQNVLTESTQFIFAGVKPTNQPNLNLITLGE